MSLILYSHPLASYCHKVLIALYEAGADFEPVMVDLSDPGGHARFLDLWPVGKMPVLRDDARDRTIPETSIIIEYLDQHYPGAQPMLPADPDACLNARLWDRFFDLYVHGPMQAMVSNQLRADNQRNPLAVSEAEQSLHMAYGMLDKHLHGRLWAIGDDFTIADCAAAPALFYAGIIVPFDKRYPLLNGYFERLFARPSYRRVLVEAQPWFDYFPFYDRMPDRFRNLGDG